MVVALALRFALCVEDAVTLPLKILLVGWWRIEPSSEHWMLAEKEIRVPAVHPVPFLGYLLKLPFLG